jgi:RecJ-like exonuclease
VGAVGDLQDTANNHMVGLNVKLLDIGEKAGVVECKKDLKMFGKQTRPVYKMLQFNSDPYIPGITANESACMNFLIDRGVAVKDESWRRWIDLTMEEKRKVISGLLQLCIKRDIPDYKMKRLVGDTYQLLHEEQGTELRDASEFSTLLNATARYGHDKVGLGICTGDREASFFMARDLLEQHRRNLVMGIEFVNSQGVTQEENVQWFHAGREIRDTIVGIVAGMVLGSNVSTVNRHKPIFAFSFAEEGGVKVSGRATKDLTMRGVHLGKAMSEIAGSLGGGGGGHDIAAGANVPVGKETEFIKLIDARIGEQLAEKKAAKAAKAAKEAAN